MTVESNNVIAIATLSDQLKNPAPVFQPMRSTTKTNRALNAWFFPRFEKVPDTRTPSLAASIKRFNKIRIQFSLYTFIANLFKR